MRRTGWLHPAALVAPLLLGTGPTQGAMLQLQGELTITNRTDELDPASRHYRLPGGQQLRLLVAGVPGPNQSGIILGETFLPPAFWPEPGESHTGAIAVDFLTPGSGVVEGPPLAVDGLALSVSLWGDGFSGGAFPQLGEIVPFNFGVGGGGRPVRVGSGTIRVDAIVPEPSTVLSLLLGSVGLAAVRHNQRNGILN